MKFKDSFGVTEKKAGQRIDGLTPEDFVIEKMAGISIYEPTIDNIEHFVKEYLQNNLYYIGKSLPISVNLIPNLLNEANPTLVEDASGLASFNYDGAKIELPFVIYHGELVPFDVIQLGNQRVPYSTENMKKIIKGIREQNQQKKDGTYGGDKPYLAVAKPVNPASSVGFLGATLSIQDQYLGKGDPRHIYAAEDVFEGLEKLAHLDPVDENAVLSILEKAAEEALVDHFEKIAAEDTTPQKDLAKIMEKMATADWQNISSQKNGTYVLIPEIKKSNELYITPEITMTPAIVIDKFMDLGFGNENVKLVITACQRMKIVRSSENMVCLVSDQPTFKLPTVKLDSINAGDVFVAFDGNKAFFPSKVTEVRDRGYANCIAAYDPLEDENQLRAKREKDFNLNTKIYYLHPVGINNEKSAFVAGNEPEIAWESGARKKVEMKLITLKGMKFGKISYDDFLVAKGKETGFDQHVIEGILGSDSACSRFGVGRNEPREIGVLVTDACTPVIHIKGVIEDYLSNAKDIEKFAEKHEDAFDKIASADEYVEVRTRDVKENTFTLKLVYTDRSQKFFKQQVKTFDNVEEYKVRGILRATGFDQMKTAEIIEKARRDNYSRMDLPANATPDTVSGVAPKGMAETKFRDIKNTIFSPDVKRELAVSLVGEILSGTGGLIQDSINAVKTSSYFDATTEKIAISKSELISVANRMESRAKKAAAASSVFEKLAIENEIQSFKEVAATCALASDLMNKVAEVITSDRYYSIDPIAENIISGTSYFEKMAFDLTQFKVEQYQENNFLVNPSHIQQAVLSMDDMMKTAHCIMNVYRK